MRFAIRLIAVRPVAAAALLTMSFGPVVVRAQGTLDDYKRGQGLQAKARGMVVNLAGTPNWIGETEHFWYSKSVKGGTEFVMVDAAAATRKPAFDHEKLAAAINSASGGHYTALGLPFAPMAGGRGGGGGGAGRGGAPGAGGLASRRTSRPSNSGYPASCTNAR